MRESDGHEYSEEVGWRGGVIMREELEKLSEE